MSFVHHWQNPSRKDKFARILNIPFFSMSVQTLQWGDSRFKCSDYNIIYPGKQILICDNSDSELWSNDDMVSLYTPSQSQQQLESPAVPLFTYWKPPGGISMESILRQIFRSCQVTYQTYLYHAPFWYW